jgi:hypothetical protein
VEPSAGRAVADNSTCTVSVALPLLVDGIATADFLQPSRYQVSSYMMVIFEKNMAEE